MIYRSGRLLLRHVSERLDACFDGRVRGEQRVFAPRVALPEREETPAAEERGYRAELRAAEDVGVRVTTEGELPLAEPALSVLRCAISECVTNTFRHAGGDALTIRVEETARGWRCRFTNDGSPPAGEVRETGGLGNLRRLCEGCGGTMRVENSPRFLLELTIPKEDGQHGL